eukprot:2788530-Lingulodinium_polyedra.AAC.1
MYEDVVDVDHEVAHNLVLALDFPDALRRVALFEGGFFVVHLALGFYEHYVSLLSPSCGCTSEAIQCLSAFDI